VSYLDELAAAQQEESAWRCPCGTENPPHYDACHTCQRPSWTCAECHTVNPTAYPECEVCGGTTDASTLYAEDENKADTPAETEHEPAVREYVTRPGFSGGPQLVAVRAWLALVFWTTADRAWRFGAVVSAIVAAAPLWAAVPAKPAFGTAVVCLAATVLAKDGLRWTGNALAPSACAPSVDLHYCTPAAQDPCACGVVPEPGTTVRRPS
jgi:hypothetical protein